MRSRDECLGVKIGRGTSKTHAGEMAWRHFCMSQTKRKKQQIPFTNRQGALILLGLAALLVLLLAISLHWS